MKQHTHAFIAALLLTSALAHGQVFQPYPQASITVQEWQSYFDEVKAKLGSSEKDAGAHNFIGFDDPTTKTTITFTKPGHPAHPAWISRRIVQAGDEIVVNQIGYFAGNEGEFAKLFQAYEAMNARLREDVRR